MFILGPSDNPVQNSKSDTTDGNFGGNRKVTKNIQSASDYTRPTLTNSEAQINPVDETIRDIDDLNDPMTRKHDTTYQQQLVDSGTPGDDNIFVSDLEKKPLDEGREDSAFQKPDPNKGHGALHPFNPDFWDVTGIDDEGN